MFERVKSTSTFETFGFVSCAMPGPRLASARLDRVTDGNFGDVKPGSHAISELRIDSGPGYRVYFIQRDSVLVVVLAGGDKRTQHADLQTARRIASDWERVRLKKGVR